ncbi:MAG: tetraacyldisaccharide 4'-kinase [Candidatus Marinimicrobia bacterium]|jgi:tetraacyldisaccharide 4'-kinase|nr:tetraacyldisaccharide 4'-kinase [Candidatus Neomarinimicrobiota bacterium]
MIYWRNLFYRFGFFITRKLPVPVISVGNITAGGTGKTPMVLALAHKLQKEGYRPAILSRGYGRNTKGAQIVSDGKTNFKSWEAVGDEPALMAKNSEGIPILVDENRFRGGMLLFEKFKPDLILLDDGFQHRSLFRDLDIVLINGKDTKKTHKLLPYGSLREPWNQLSRADVIIVTKNTSNKNSSYLNRKLNTIKSPIYRSNLLVENHLKSLDKTQIIISEMKDKKAFLFSALGDNKSFEDTANKAGIRIEKSYAFTDHHKYTNIDLKLIQKKFISSKSDYLLTTEKDMIKLNKDWSSLPIYALAVKMTLPENLGLSNMLD